MQDENETLEAPGLLSALPAILWQRRWFLIVPFVVALAAGIAAAFLIPPKYRSQGVIIIESQQLPADLVNSPVTDVIDQRIARVRQRVLSRPDLIQLIRQNNLYPREQKSQPLSKIIDKMRDDTSINAISADIQGSGWRGGGGTNTIAFTIGFEYPDPAKAQLVAQQFVNHFLELDATAQAEQAVGSATFLGEQANAIQDKIRAIDAQITKIKAENGNVLALGSITMGTGDPTADAARIDSEISGLEAENARLAAEPVRGDDNGVGQLEQALRVAQAKYSDTHPDVLSLKAQVEAAKRAAAQSPAVNPNRAQIAGNNARIAALRGARGMVLSQSASAQAARARAPAIAEQVAQLEKQADGLRDQYREIGSKLTNAQVSARMETEQKGERMTLTDPPVLPDHPVWPNRPLILLGSAVFGLGIGLAAMLLMELFFRPIRGTAALRAAAGVSPLVVIPLLDKPPNALIRFFERRSRRKLARAS